MKVRTLFASLVLASASALAADTLAIDSIAGVYKFSHTLTAVDAPSYTAEDVLEIVKVSPQRAYIRTRLYFTNGHQCSLYGVANLRGETLTYSTKAEPSGDVCELSLRVENGRIVFHDKDSKCMQHNCGMRGSFEGIGFAVSGRRDIRYLPRLLASREYKGALAEAGIASPAAPPAVAASAVTVTPMHVKGSNVRFPRINGLANVAAMNKINAALAAQEKSVREDRQGCLDLVRDAGRPARDAHFEIVIDARYVTARYVSLEIRRSYDCAGPYPTDDSPEPMTFDLMTGEALDWSKLFEPGFLLDENGDADRVPTLIAMYQARYAKEGGAADPECKRAVQENVGTIVLRLDARKGLVVQPDFPHVMAACADEIAFSPAQLAPHVRDPNFLADLKAAMGK